MFLPRSMRFNYNKHRPWLDSVAVLMQIGLTMAGCIVFCFFVGLYLDRWLGVRGIFVSVFTVLGVIGGGVTVYRQIREMLKPNRKDRNGPEGNE
jgi:F0F1-type ATP synthase assembly protein I